MLMGKEVGQASSRVAATSSNFRRARRRAVPCRAKPSRAACDCKHMLVISDALGKDTSEEKLLECGN